jgi:hypothetical protein
MHYLPDYTASRSRILSPLKSLLRKSHISPESLKCYYHPAYYVALVTVTRTALLHNVAVCIYTKSHLTFFIFHVATAPIGSGSAQCRGFTNTLRHTTLDKISLDEWPARRRDLYLTTHTTHKRQTDLHAPRGIRTLNPNNRAPTDRRLRPHSHWISDLRLLAEAHSLSVCTLYIE